MKRIYATLFVVFAFFARAEAQPYDVTFIVDMNEVTDAFTTPEVNGNFNGWCGGCAPMEDGNCDNIWEITIPLDAGTYEFKFAADTWTIQESLTVGDPCTITVDIFTNRIFTVAEDMVMDTVCWASCSSCEEVVPSHDVLFKVDMSQVTESYTTPEVNGTFNGWCGGCAPMSDDDGDDIWELTITLPEGTYEYKFAYDSWAGDEALTEGDTCTVTAEGFTNRFLDVTGPITMDPVCWASCDECESLPNSIEDAGNAALNVWPVPASEQLFLMLDGNANATVQIVSINGAIMYAGVVTPNLNTIDIASIPAGAYIVSVISNEGNATSRGIIIE